MNKKLIKAAVIGALFSVAPLSFAADEVEDIKAPSMLDEFSFSANVGLYSDYVFRGYTQTQIHMPNSNGAALGQLQALRSRPRCDAATAKLKRPPLRQQYQ